MIKRLGDVFLSFKPILQSFQVFYSYQYPGVQVAKETGCLWHNLSSTLYMIML